MTPQDGLGSSERLERLRDLLAGLGGELVTGDVLGWVSPGELGDVPHEVYTVVANAGLLGDGEPRYPPTTGRNRIRSAMNQPSAAVPADADALMSQLWEIDEPTAIDLLTTLADATGAPRPHRRQFRRRYQQEPQDVFAEIASLMGADAQWWTSTDLTTWNPVTARPFDAVVVSAGNGLIVTLVAFQGGA